MLSTSNNDAETLSQASWSSQVRVPSPTTADALTSRVLGKSTAGDEGWAEYNVVT